MWLVLALLVLVAWGGLSPLRYATREKLLELGDGPVRSSLRLTLGVRDVLVLRNRGSTAQVFGQLRVLPGHVIHLPFEEAGVFDFACSAQARGTVVVQVVAPPDPGLARLRWRAGELADALRDLPAAVPPSS